MPDKAGDVSETETLSESTDAGTDSSETHENGERQDSMIFNGSDMGDWMHGGNGGGGGGNAGR